MFSYLAMALHHLDLAEREHYVEDEEEEDASYLHVDFDEVGQIILAAQDHRVRNPFKKLSPDLFLKTVSCFDAPSLISSSATCKSWRNTIFESSEIFRNFKMEGKLLGIIDGIKFFSTRCGNSIRSISITVDKVFSTEHQEALTNAISPSFESLKELSVYHHGDMGKVIVGIAGQCPSLTLLRSSNKSGHRGSLSVQREVVAIPSIWKPTLRTLIWNS